MILVMQVEKIVKQDQVCGREDLKPRKKLMDETRNNDKDYSLSKQNLSETEANKVMPY